jgi:hypothetical protein
LFELPGGKQPLYVHALIRHELGALSLALFRCGFGLVSARLRRV